MIPIEQALTAVKTMKEADDWADLMPFLHLFHESDHQSVIALPDIGGGPSAWIAIAQLLIQARVVDGPLEGSLYVTDARMRTLQPGETLEGGEDLQTRWLAGDREGITECLMLTFVMGDGSYKQIYQPYNAEDRTWGESFQASSDDPDSPEAGGGMMDALRLGTASIAPTGVKDADLDKFISDSHTNPLIRASAREAMGMPSDDQDEKPRPDPDRVSLADYMED